MLTLYINARVGRSNIERSVEHERNMLKNALSAELELTLTYFHELTKSVGKNEEETSAFYPEEIPQLVYKTFISNLGLLSSEQTATVITAYAVIYKVCIPLIEEALASLKNS